MRNYIFILLLFSFISVFSQKLSNTVQITELSDEDVIKRSVGVVPSFRQLSALENGFIAFVHFGPNTFTAREWGSGMEDPKVFDLHTLDTDQWCETMKDAGMRMVILTAKHHDGFVLWQSRYTDHGIMSSGFENGKGDIMRSLSMSCKKYGLKLGVYLSPADLYQIESPSGLYGNGSEATLRTIPRYVEGRPFADKRIFRFEVDDYNEYFLNQLFELLTEYGTISEVWFDGAHPKTKGGQKYNYKAWRELIRTLAPEATIFGREDIRWCGNEGGDTRESEWNTIPYDEDPGTMTHFFDLHGDLGSREKILSHKRPYYLHYQPAEIDTSIREGWFYRDDSYQNVRTSDDVFDMYERGVGGNAILLLNIPPNKEGRFSPRDVNTLKEVGKRIRETYGVDLMSNSDRDVRLGDVNLSTAVSLYDTNEVIITFNEPMMINRILLQEPVNISGERIERFRIEGECDGNWKLLASATNIGYKRIVRFPDSTISKVKIVIEESRDEPFLSTVSAHFYPAKIPMFEAKRGNDGLVTITVRDDGFRWNRKKDGNKGESISEYEVYYSIDGSDVSKESKRYSEPFELGSGEVRIVAYREGDRGDETTSRIGYDKSKWEVASDKNEPDSLKITKIDMGKIIPFNSYRYNPVRSPGAMMIEEGVIMVSIDGKKWEEIPFIFGNLINDPTPRFVSLGKKYIARFLKIVPKKVVGKNTEVFRADFDFFQI